MNTIHESVDTLATIAQLIGLEKYEAAAALCNQALGEALEMEEESDRHWVKRAAQIGLSSEECPF